jgi:ribonucleoside-diphosphate reductase alpha chain
MTDKILKIYSKQEVEKSTLQYFKNDELATNVWLSKYCLKDEKNYYELNPDDMHHRLAKEFFSIEKTYNNDISKNLSEYGKKRETLTEEKIFNYFKNFKYISPQGSIMNMLGNNDVIGSLSNCVVVPKIFDSYGGIMFADQQLAQLFKRRCGAGIDISTLRPAKYKVTNAAGTSTGAISFMERFSNTTREVGQCLIFNSLILTKDGIKEIRNITNNDYVWTRIGWVKVNKLINNGKKETYKLKTKRGYEIISSCEHIYLNGDNKETKLKDFNIGDNVVLLVGSDTNFEELSLEHIEYVSKQPHSIINLNKLSFPKLLNKDLAYLLGYSYGDGHFSYNRKGKPETLHLSIHGNDTETLKKLQNIILSEFNYIAKEKKGSGNVKKLNIYSVELCEWLKYNEIAKEKAFNIKIPNLILKSNSDIQMSFFSGYFDADGCAHKTGKNVRASSISHDFILEMQKLLLGNGVISNIQTFISKEKNRHVEYRLNIQGSYSQEQLIFKTNSIKLKNMTRCSMQENILSPYTYKNFNHLVNIRKNFPYVPMYNNRKISISALNKLYKKTENEEKISFIDEIINIEKFGEYDTYDLKLDEEHLFWCEGFYVHNSGRRGALMTSIDVRHPDIFDFVKIKRDLKKVTGSNISIMLRDDFMEAVTKNDKYVLRFPVDSNIEDALITKEINAIDLWNEIIKSAHQCAEPGLIFKDRQHLYSTSSIYPNWLNISTNPCSEIAMNDDSCRLMIVNYFGCVINPFTKQAIFDFNKLYEISYEAQRLIDDLVDLELLAVKKIINKIKNDPEPEYIKSVELETWKNLYNKGKAGRRTGLGFTGIGDVFASLGLKYDSNEAMKLLNKISETKFLAEFDSSIDMAIQRGKFDDFNPEYENKSEFVLMIKNEYPELYERMMKFGRRNISISTVAPTGSLSILTQTTSGIEPLFMIGYKRRKKINPNEKNVKIDFVDEMGDSWIEFEVLHPRVKEWKEINNVSDVNINNPYIGSTASEIDWLKRIKIQSIVQKYVTHSISSTINLPKDVTPEKVSEIYLEAWKMKLKGITVYRDGSRSGVLIADESKKEVVEFQENNAPKRPKRLKGEIHRFQNNLEKWIAVVGLKDGKPYELFTGLLINGLSNIPLNIKDCEIVKNIIETEELDENGKLIKVRKKRYDIEYTDSNGIKQIHIGLNQAFNPEFWNYAKLISGILRHGMPLIKVYELIDSLTFREENINTWKNGVVRVIKRYIIDGEKTKGKCPECGGTDFIFEEGCIRCKNCSWGKC